MSVGNSSNLKIFCGGLVIMIVVYFFSSTTSNAIHQILRRNLFHDFCRRCVKDHTETGAGCRCRWHNWQRGRQRGRRRRELSPHFGKDQTRRGESISDMVRMTNQKNKDSQDHEFGSYHFIVRLIISSSGERYETIADTTRTKRFAYIRKKFVWERRKTKSGGCWRRSCHEVCVSVPKLTWSFQ